MQHEYRRPAWQTLVPLLVVVLVAPGAAGRGAATQLPACQLSPVNRNGSNFDYWQLSAWWPPSLLSFSSSWAGSQLESIGQANTGFWLHGWWPATSEGDSLMDCGAAALQPSSLPQNLSFWWPGSTSPFTTASAMNLWQHEWDKHGTCSNETQAAYFSQAKAVAAHHLPRLEQALAAGGIVPNNNSPYTLGAIQAALQAAYGPAFRLTCQTQRGHLALEQVQLCLSRWMQQPCNCFGLANGTVKKVASSCGLDPQGLILIPALETKRTFGGVTLDKVVGMTLAALGALAAVLLVAWLVAWQCGFITPLLKPRRVVTVHNPLVRQPVTVHAERLDMERLWQDVPSLAHFVDDLPTGMAIKGGIARKIIKRLYGTPEPPSSFDIDCLVLLPDAAFEQQHQHQQSGKGGAARASAAVSAATEVDEVLSPQRLAHDAVTGIQIGALTLEAQDVEVMPMSHLRDYFLSRDVTMNEVLILKEQDAAWLYYTDICLADVRENLIRPSCHMQASDMQVYWDVDARTGRPFIATSVVCRCIIRYLKGHGSDYAFDAGTFEHYRRDKLDKMSLFKVLRAFHMDGANMQAALDHLVDIGFTRRLDVWRAGGCGKLWGLLLQDVNNEIARHGGRLTLGQLDPEGVEKWVATKKAQTANKRVFGSLKARRTGWVASHETSEELGIVTLPGELEDYISHGATFDYVSFAAQRQKQLHHALALDAPEHAQLPPADRSVGPFSSAAAATWAADGPDALAPRGGSAGSIMLRRQAWQSLMTAASLAGPGREAAVQDVLDHHGSRPLSSTATTAWAAGAAPVSGSHSMQQQPQQHQHQQQVDGGQSTRAKTLSELLSAGSSGLLAPSAAAAGRTRSGVLPHQRGAGGALADAGVLTQQAAIRANAAATQRLPVVERAQQQHLQRQQQKQEGVDAAAAGQGPGSTPAAPTPATPAAAAAATAGSKAEPAAAGGVEQQQQQQQPQPQPQPAPLWLRYSEVGCSYVDPAAAQLGSFHQTLDESMLPPGQSSLVSDSDRTGKPARPLGELLGFIVSTMAGEKWLFVAAYTLVLCGSGFALVMPWVEGQIFDLLAPWARLLFLRQILYLGVAMAGWIILQAFGFLLLEHACRGAMERLFQRLFNHLLAQDPAFFKTISRGELMSRLSGDCLALRMLLSSSIINIIEGVVVGLAVIGVLGWVWSVPFTGSRFYEMMLPLAVALAVFEGVVMSFIARKLSTRMRSCMGRMFGFLLDALSHIDTVTGLGLQGLVSQAYGLYVRDVFRSTFTLNCAMIFQRTFTLSLMNAVFLLFMLRGGLAIINGLSSIGTLVATLRFIRLQQRSTKMAMDAAVRFTATLGNLERLMELHDKGTLPSVQDAAAAAGDKSECPDQQQQQPQPQPQQQPKRSQPGDDAADATLLKDAGASSAMWRQALRNRGATKAPAGGSPRRPQGCAALRSGLTLLSDVPAAVQLVGGGAPAATAAASAQLFARMTGGVALRDVGVMVPGRAGRGSILRGLNMQVLPGAALVVTGGASEPLDSLLEAVLLLSLPFQGQVLLQLRPGGDSEGGGSHAPPHHTATSTGCDSSSSSSNSSSHNAGGLATQPQPKPHTVIQVPGLGGGGEAAAGDHAATATAACAGLPGCWHAVQHLNDFLPSARAHMALVTPQTGVFFRGAVEDNVTCAAAAAAADAAADPGVRGGVTNSAVVAVCREVGLHEEVMALPDGYRTVVGEGTGFVLSPHAPLQLALARALLKRPRLLLIGGYAAFADALGPPALTRLLRTQMERGCAVLVTATEGSSAEAQRLVAEAAAAMGAARLRMVGGTLEEA